MKLLDTFKERHPKTFRYLSGGIVTVARYHLAGLFLLSGITKAVNPFGLSVKLGEYFGALGVEFLTPLSGVGAILLPALELMIGWMLLAGISRRIAAWLSFLTLGFFTLLTLWLAVANPISDCGCFGDVIQLSNWETFTKNLLFMLFAVIFFMARNEQRKHNPSKQKTVILYAVFIPLSLGTGLYARNHLPIIDPTPFKIGVNVPQAMESGDSDIETTLIYREIATGKTREFTLDDTTWYDTSKWEYVDTKTRGESAAPKIAGIPMFDGDTDLSGEIFSDPGYNLIYVINRYDPKFEKQITELAVHVQKHDGRAVALSATPLPEQLEHSGIKRLGSDITSMRTMMQQRYGGALLLLDGTVLEKWALSDLPAGEDPIETIATNKPEENDRKPVILFFLTVAVIVLATHIPFKRKN